ncbi:MAG: hypothetical protein KC609_12145, partial [Myxococcales bacterium]|nr:hypothetical protein [Myxococcales bacterium]
LEGNIELDHTFFKMLRLYTDTSLFFSTQRKDILVKLNEAIIQLTPHEYVDLWVGKKRVAFSPGFSFTPSDVLNPGKNPTDPTLQREGRYGAGIQFPFDKVTLSLTWAVWERDTQYGLPSTFKFPRSAYQARVYLNLWESDINIF